MSSNDDQFTQHNRQLIIMSLLSNVTSGMTGHQYVLEIGASAKIRKILNEKVMNDFMQGTWKIVWGPGVQFEAFPFESIIAQGNVEKENAPDHMMFVAKRPESINPDEDAYVISVAGSNGTDAFVDNWLHHNLNIRQETWPFGGNFDPKIKISAGALSGLNHILSIDPSGEDGTLLQFLQKTMAEADKKVRIITTGFSLGGALSPALALYLHQQQQRWNPDHKPCTVHCTSVAGYSIGNPAFVEMYEGLAKEGLTIDRWYNEIDLIPCMWNAGRLGSIPFLYADDLNFLDIPADAIRKLLEDVPGLLSFPPFKKLASYGIKKIVENDDLHLDLQHLFRDIIQDLMQVEYQHITRGIVLTNTKYHPEKSQGDNIFEKFISQVAYQHTLGYIDALFDIPGRQELHAYLVEQLEALDFIPKQKSKEAGQLMKNAMKRVAMVSLQK